MNPKPPNPDSCRKIAVAEVFWFSTCATTMCPISAYLVTTQKKAQNQAFSKARFLQINSGFRDMKALILSKNTFLVTCKFPIRHQLFFVFLKRTHPSQKTNFISSKVHKQVGKGDDEPKKSKN